MTNNLLVCFSIHGAVATAVKYGIGLRRFASVCVITHAQSATSRVEAVCQIKACRYIYIGLYIYA